MEKQRFLENTDHTGRFCVYSVKTGITYYVEPLDGKDRVTWGDLNPASKNIEGAYGTKYKGSIHPSESLINEEEFKNVVILERGVSPQGYINEIDEIRYKEGFRPKEKQNDS